VSGLVCLPPAGYRNDTDLNNQGNNGYYWSSTPNENNKNNAYNLNFNSNNVNPDNNDNRNNGNAIRLVALLSPFLRLVLWMI